jgi:hypothetical protein
MKAVNFPQSQELNDRNVQNGGDDKFKVYDAPFIKQGVDDSGWTMVKQKFRPKVISSKEKRFSSKSMAKKKPLVTKANKAKDRISLKKIIAVGATSSRR